jgi:hypothetical protein
MDHRAKYGRTILEFSKLRLPQQNYTAVDYADATPYSIRDNRTLCSFIGNFK